MNVASAGQSSAVAAPDSVPADTIFGADHDQVSAYIATKQRAEQSNTAGLQHHHTVQDSLEKIFRSDLSNGKASITRPAMTAVEREHLYHHMMQMDHFKTELILHKPADTSVGGSDTQVFLNRLAAASQATEMIRQAFWHRIPVFEFSPQIAPQKCRILSKPWPVGPGTKSQVPDNKIVSVPV